MKTKNYAPIILFVYRRLDTLKQVIKNLKKNKLSKLSDIYIFSDGYKNLNDKKNVLAVRTYLKNIQGFKNKKIILRNKNLGLAKNIISGTSKILSLKGKGIIIEDDIIVSPNFLTYMNLCLEKFKEEKKIWHINAWNYNIKLKSCKYDVFYWKGMHCWGWATWYNKWKFYKKDPKKLIRTFSDKDIKKFNYDGYFDFWRQVIRNYKSKIDSWAIFWYAIIFKNKGLCVSPLESLTFNIGHDKYATNTFMNIGKNHHLNFTKFHNKKVFKFQTELKENIELYNIIKKHLQTAKAINIFNRFTGLKKIINLF